MRVLTFLHSFEPGGVERVALRLVARWRAAGIDAPLFLGRTEGPLRAELAADLVFASPPQPWAGTAWWETLWMILTLPGTVRRSAPDVLFCAGNTYSIVVVAMKLILGRRCPPVVAKISNDLVRPDLPTAARAGWRLWLRIQARFVDHWVVMDAAILPDVDRLLGRVARTVIPDPAIDQLPPPPEHADRGGGTRYLAVGRLVAQKDHATMLAAFADIAGGEDRLTIFGDGPLRVRLSLQAERLGIADRVIFAGHVSRAADAMADHDVLLLSSRYEGVPAVLVEALAAGLAIVATDCGPGVRALLDGGRLGHLVPPGDAAMFARAMTDVAARAVDVDAARRQAARFSLDSAFARYLDVFAHAARADRRPALFRRTLERAA